MVKNPPTMQETWVRSLGWEEPLEKGTAAHSSYSGLENSMDFLEKFMGLQIVKHNSDIHQFEIIFYFNYLLK